MQYVCGFFFLIRKLWLLLIYMASPVKWTSIQKQHFFKNTKQSSFSDDVRGWLLWSCYGVVHFVKLVPRSSFHFEILKEKISL